MGWVTCALHPNCLRLTSQACAEFHRQAQGESLDAEHVLSVCRYCSMCMQNAGAVTPRRLQETGATFSAWSS